MPASVVDISDFRADTVPKPTRVLDNLISQSREGPKVYELVDEIAWRRANGDEVASLEAELRSILMRIQPK